LGRVGREKGKKLSSVLCNVIEIWGLSGLHESGPNFSSVKDKGSLLKLWRRSYEQNTENVLGTALTLRKGQTPRSSAPLKQEPQVELLAQNIQKRAEIRFLQGWFKANIDVHSRGSRGNSVRLV
jgi:hypothetical protein